jgi:hypothetical protein
MGFTKLPPGEAEGARDLALWASQRASRDKPKRKPDAADRWLAKRDLAERMRKAGFRPRKAKVK